VQDFTIVQVQKEMPQFAAYCGMRAEFWKIIESENLAEARSRRALGAIARLHGNGL
jgi:hypothetical protein